MCRHVYKQIKRNFKKCAHTSHISMSIHAKIILKIIIVHFSFLKHFSSSSSFLNLELNAPANKEKWKFFMPKHNGGPRHPSDSKAQLFEDGTVWTTCRGMQRAKRLCRGAMAEPLLKKKDNILFYNFYINFTVLLYNIDTLFYNPYFLYITSLQI